MSARAKHQNRGKVFLVGAGPGAFDLITIRGADVLSRADVVIYDHLVSPELIRLAAPKAELIYAGKKGGAGKGIASTVRSSRSSPAMRTKARARTRRFRGTNWWRRLGAAARSLS